MNRSSLRIAGLVLAGALLTYYAPGTAHAQAPASSEQSQENIAYAIGMDAVFYGFAPVMVQLGLRGQTDADKPYDNGQAPVNQMGHARRLYGPEDKFVVTANNDTLYSFAGLDLSKEPVVLRVPNTQGRYYIMQLIDAYSRSVEDIGVGTLGALGGRSPSSGQTGQEACRPKWCQSDRRRHRFTSLDGPAWMVRATCLPRERCRISID
jgi:hypothetical protein